MKNRVPTRKHFLCLSIKNLFWLEVSFCLCLTILPINSFAQPLASGHDKFIGCATSHYLSRYLTRYFNQITPGNAGKWGSVEPAQGYYNWTNLDTIYKFAVKKGLPFKHHTLVWVSQQPGWIASLDTAAQRKAVEKWIEAVGKRYPLMSMVDVVNEPFHGAPSYAAALGGAGVTGYDWVIKSFQLARKYCPAGAQLILNEYNVVHDNTVTTNYISLINLLKERGLIDAIGVQGHYFEFRSDMDATTNIYVHSTSTIKANLDRLGALGLPIYISEFDIDEPTDANQLSQYQIYFPIFWNHPAVKGMTFWGYIQDDVWTSHPDTYLLLANGTERAALKWLRTYVLKPLTPVQLAPKNTIDEPRNPLLVWKPSALATSYRVEVSNVPAFTSILIDSMVADTVLQLPLLPANTRYFWRVSALNNYGASAVSGSLFFVTGIKTLVVDRSIAAPVEYQLLQNYPNPFNPSTRIAFTIPKESLVRLQVYDLLGRLIATLVYERMPAGNHTVTFDAKGLNSGTYFYKISTEDFSDTKRMMLIR